MTASSKPAADPGTPVLRQYLDAKAEFPDAVMLFRLGDFFETFQEDAEVASRVLGITLTSRDFGRSGRHPMAGFPAHAADGHIGKLLRAGHSVAVCDQVEAASAARGLVRREVVRVLTPGTVLEGALLDPARDNLLVSLAIGGATLGVALLEASAARVELMEVPADFDMPELLRSLGASEVLLPTLADNQEPDPLGAVRAAGAGVELAELDGWRFETERGRRRALELTGATSLLGFDCDDLGPALGALGAAVDYLERSRVQLPAGLFRMRRRRPEQLMHLDPATIANLELVENLGGGGRGVLGLCDRTHTAMGARRLRARLLAPLIDPEAITERLAAVAELVVADQLRADLAAEISQVRDLERLTTRAAQGRAAPRDLGAIRDSLPAVGRLREVLSGRAPSLAAVAVRLADLPALAVRLDAALERSLPAALADGGLVRPGFDAALDELRTSIESAQAWIAGLETREKEATGIRGLKVGFTRVFGYYIEVSNANRQALPPNYTRKQTLAGAERYVTEELKQREAVVLNGEQEIISREREVFLALCDEVRQQSSSLLDAADAVAEVDVTLSLARAAIEHRWVQPEVDAGLRLEVAAGRHPLVEAALPSGTFVANDAELVPDARLILLTGPNMAGKSTYLRQVGIIVLLAQAGSFVPADRARVGVVDRIFTRVGAQDSISSGLSTFMVEMVETARILHHATPHSLVLIDEIGRGTSTYDGMSIAQAVLERLHDEPGLGCRTIFATHFHELTALDRGLSAMRNYRVEVSEAGGRVTFLHRIVPGGADRSYGINVAEIAGLPAAVTARAREVLAELEAARPLSAASAVPGLAQLALPLDVEHPLLAELRGLDVDSLSPLEALNRLARMKAEHRLPGAATPTDDQPG